MEIEELEMEAPTCQGCNALAYTTAPTYIILIHSTCARRPTYIRVGTRSPSDHVNGRNYGKCKALWGKPRMWWPSDSNDVMEHRSPRLTTWQEDLLNLEEEKQEKGPQGEGKPGARC